MIRLPGYPLFLAVCFKLFGIENYFAPALIQIVLELLGCLLLADFAARIAPPGFAPGARHATLWLAALCPFTASFAVAPLAESLTLFSLALAHVGHGPLRRPADSGPAPSGSPSPSPTLPCFARTAPWQPLRLRRRSFLPFGRAMILQSCPSPRLLRMAVVCALLALAPFTVWTWRNWQAFHVFQPLAPRLATDPGEDPHLGWERWIKILVSRLGFNLRCLLERARRHARHEQASEPRIRLP